MTLEKYCSLASLEKYHFETGANLLNLLKSHVTNREIASVKFRGGNDFKANKENHHLLCWIWFVLKREINKCNLCCMWKIIIKATEVLRKLGVLMASHEVSTCPRVRVVPYSRWGVSTHIPI